MKCQACGYNSSTSTWDSPEFKVLQIELANWITSHLNPFIEKINSEGTPIINLYICPNCRTIRTA